MTVLDVRYDEFGDTKYFNFSAEEFSNMVGFDDWHNDEFRIVQSGSHSWEGMINVHNWKDNPTPVGMSDSDWEVNDTITLKSCSNPGKISSFHYQLISYF